jgi:ribosomal protein L37E
MPEKLEPIKPIKCLLASAKENVEVVEKGNTLGKEEYKKLEQLFRTMDKILFSVPDNPIPYYVPLCPKCSGILGQMCMSPLIICLKCGREFYLDKYNLCPKCHIPLENKIGKFAKEEHWQCPKCKKTFQPK